MVLIHSGLSLKIPLPFVGVVVEALTQAAWLSLGCSTNRIVGPLCILDNWMERATFDLLGYSSNSLLLRLSLGLLPPPMEELCMRGEISTCIIALLSDKLLCQLSALVIEFGRLRSCEGILCRRGICGHEVQAVEVELAELCPKLLGIEAHEEFADTSAFGT
jgi:hypothetical protein